MLSAVKYVLLIASSFFILACTRQEGESAGVEKPVYNPPPIVDSANQTGKGPMLTFKLHTDGLLTYKNPTDTGYREITVAKIDSLMRTYQGKYVKLIDVGKPNADL